MIITDITLIDNMAKQMFCHNPNFIAIDMNDYNRIKSSSSYPAATSVEMPRTITTGIVHFQQAISEFQIEGVNQILLQICGVSSALEVEQIRFKEMCLILNAVEDHFGQRNVIEKQTLHVTSAVDKSICQKVNIVWGLSNRKSGDANGYEINIIVGYK